MADILKDLVDACNDDLTLRIDDGTFTWLKSHQIIQPNGEIPDEYSLILPAILVSGSLVSIEPLCVQGQTEAKVYHITYSILKYTTMTAELSAIGDTYHTGLYDMVTELETLYRREQFNLSDGVQMLAPDYNARFPAEFDGGDIEQAHVTFVHQYVDQRGESVYRYKLKASGVQTLGATDTLTVTHPIMLVQSDGGSVTITSTPTINPGEDWQAVCVMGVSDADYPTFQDETNLSGSGLKHKGKRDYTFGLNDSTWYVYNPLQSKWVEFTGRSDVY